MTQQQPLQPQSQGVQSQQSTGQSGQAWGGQQTGGQQIGGQLSQPGRLQPQQRAALDSVTRAIEVCEWCADQCVQEANPNMIECIRLCEDVSEIGEATLALVPRNSRFSQQAVQALQQAVQMCAQECSRHPHAHCQECANVLGQALNSIQQLGQQPSGQGVQYGR